MQAFLFFSCDKHPWKQYDIGKANNQQIQD